MPEPQSAGSAIVQFLRCALVWCPPRKRLVSLKVSRGAIRELDSYMKVAERIKLGEGWNFDGVPVVQTSQSKEVRVFPVYGPTS